jgi:hypothetical protein
MKNEQEFHPDQVPKFSCHDLLEIGVEEELE